MKKFFKILKWIYETILNFEELSKNLGRKKKSCLLNTEQKWRSKWNSQEKKLYRQESKKQKRTSWMLWKLNLKEINWWNDFKRKSLRISKWNNRLLNLSKIKEMLLLRRSKKNNKRIERFEMKLTKKSMKLFNEKEKKML